MAALRVSESHDLFLPFADLFPYNSRTPNSHPRSQQATLGPVVSLVAVSSAAKSRPLLVAGS